MGFVLGWLAAAACSGYLQRACHAHTPGMRLLGFAFFAEQNMLLIQSIILHYSENKQNQMQIQWGPSAVQNTHYVGSGPYILSMSGSKSTW